MTRKSPAMRWAGRASCSWAKARPLSRSSLGAKDRAGDKRSSHTVTPGKLTHVAIRQIRIVLAHEKFTIRRLRPGADSRRGSAALQRRLRADQRAKNGPGACPRRRDRSWLHRTESDCYAGQLVRMRRSLIRKVPVRLEVYCPIRTACS